MTGTDDPMPKDKSDAAIAFAMDALRRAPKGDRVALEAHLTGVLVIFWGALWGTFGTDYARDFIEAQLRSMEGQADVFTPPRVQ